MTLFLLGDILNRFNSTDNEIREQLVEVALINETIVFCHDTDHATNVQDSLGVLEDLIADGIPSTQEKMVKS